MLSDGLLRKTWIASHTMQILPTIRITLSAGVKSWFRRYNATEQMIWTVAYPRQMPRISERPRFHPYVLVVFRASILPDPGVKEQTSIYPNREVNVATVIELHSPLFYRDRSEITSNFIFYSLRCIAVYPIGACLWQRATHFPQPIHFWRLICAFRPSIYKLVIQTNLQKHKHGCAGCAPVPEKAYRTFLFSAPGVVTITFSGVMTSAPFAVAAPLNIFSTIALKVSTILPSVTYSALPLI